MVFLPSGYLNLTTFSPIATLAMTDWPKHISFSEEGVGVIEGIVLDRTFLLTVRLEAVRRLLERGENRQYSGEKLHIIDLGDRKIRLVDLSSLEFIYQSPYARIDRARGEILYLLKPPKEVHFALKSVLETKDFAFIHKQIQAGVDALHTLPKEKYPQGLMKPSIPLYLEGRVKYYLSKFYNETDLLLYVANKGSPLLDRPEKQQEKVDFIHSLLALFVPLLKALAVLEKERIIYMDAKVDNVFVKTEKGKPKGKLGDMDGVYKVFPLSKELSVQGQLDQLKQHIDKRGRIVLCNTPGYLPVETHQLKRNVCGLCDYLKGRVQADPARVLANYQESVDYSPKMLVFSVALMMISALSFFKGETPGNPTQPSSFTKHVNDEKNPYVIEVVFDEIDRVLREIGYPAILTEAGYNQLFALFREMLDKDFTKRPSCEVVAVRYETLLKDLALLPREHGKEDLSIQGLLGQLSLS